MSIQELSSVTNELIQCYGNTAKNVINAYRVGGERVVGFMDQRWETAVEKAGKRLTAEVRNNALATQKKLSGYYIKGISLTTDGADSVVSKVVELAGKGVAQVAANASQFEKATGVSTLNTIALAVVPAAEAVSKVAARIEEKSSELVNRVSGKKARVKVAAVKRVTPFKKARARKAA
jgi:hypothetical protein